MPIGNLSTDKLNDPGKGDHRRKGADDEKYKSNFDKIDFSKGRPSRDYESDRSKRRRGAL